MNLGDNKISSLPNKQTNQHARVVKREAVAHLSPKQFRERVGCGIG